MNRKLGVSRTDAKGYLKRRYLTPSAVTKRLYLTPWQREWADKDSGRAHNSVYTLLGVYMNTSVPDGPLNITPGLYADVCTAPVQISRTWKV